MDRSRLGIVIPALNESATIKGVVSAVKIYGIPIIVDDGSTDDTKNAALQAGGIVISHEINQGYDAALNTGFMKASDIGCEIIITLDADGQHNPSLINNFINHIELGADVVIGVRGKCQRFSEHFFVWYGKLRFNINDPLSGMKAYKTDVYRNLGHFDSYGSIGTELIFFAAKNNYRIDQIPINVVDRSGKSRFGSAILGNFRILRALIYSILKGW
jgi:glycosyltransferase involved in cell wall biosynthesis